MAAERSPRPRRDSSKGLGPLWLVFLLIPAALIYPYTPLTELVFCPFRALTGLICPGCGMTRSMTALVTADIAGSIAAHPGGPILLFGLTVAGVLRAADRWAGRTVLASWRRRWKKIETPVYLVLLVAVIGLWAVRLFGHCAHG